MHTASCGANLAALGGNRGGPMTGTPSRDKSIPASLTLSHTKRARPRMLAKGTPPPWPTNHILESWLLFRLSPITQTSPGLATNGP
jgi:hypothetical protein